MIRSLVAPVPRATFAVLLVLVGLVGLALPLVAQAAAIDADRAGERRAPGIRVIGTARPDLLRGTGRDDVLKGRGGSDTVYSFAGDDVIVLGNGRADLAEAGPGNDRLVGGPGPDVLNGGSGRDVIRGGSAGDDIFDLGGNDRVAAGSGADSVTAGAGRDSFRLGSGNDVIGLGVDGARDTISCGPGHDEVAWQSRRDPADVVAADCEVLRVSGCGGVGGNQCRSTPIGLRDLRDQP